jgi:hypothetical protein
VRERARVDRVPQISSVMHGARLAAWRGMLTFPGLQPARMLAHHP